ncbi:class I mannose-6-phosphate isomerase [Qipengyuania citrea]|uniref:Mannose-6-phosphate isomerase n=1 Tax=Qipengyuania citrea TaxID=225971 RepID=A0ABU0N7Q9_9SPHN|nr:class I mannose-6-phosphate isomerase [Qipengyuania citrea]MDQ0565458.1 mannose-6-phosphate isomerase [Qipengyuania citrea]
MIQKLRTRFVEKVWGVSRLPPLFGHSFQKPIGEVWFEPTRDLDQLLAKYIFASERLSVQAHPTNEQARALGLGTTGKSECWVITHAEPGARIAAGFREKISAEHMQAAALDGSIIDLLDWHEVYPGDAFYIPGGTVHAIGGGVSLIEVQQNNDITFRLFDYGRPRELHLDRGVEIADTAPYPSSLRSRIDGDAGQLVDGPHFDLFYWRCGGEAPFPGLADHPALFIPFSGTVGIGKEDLAVGECAVVHGPRSDMLHGDALLLIAQPRR